MTTLRTHFSVINIFVDSNSLNCLQTKDDDSMGAQLFSRASTEWVGSDQLNTSLSCCPAMRNFVQLLALFILTLQVFAEDFQKIGFKDCKSKFKVLDVQASGCHLKDTPTGRKLCEFKEGTTPRIRIKFIPDETVSSLKTHIKAKIGQTFLEFPMADADACKYGR
ncbi:unnamed protein product [Haemonchus placei]|uniref:ML domain-containing protein n=1 Tax=Haemonchus placei TaxID=6290 RepID=A0A0N4VUV7_HAEPC|nr:unnamed protein product [Haemonchus placei]